MEKENEGGGKRRKVTYEEAYAKLWSSPSPSRRGYWYFPSEEFEAIFPLLPPLHRSSRRVRGEVIKTEPTSLVEEVKQAPSKKLVFDDSETQDENLGFDDSQDVDDSEGIEESFASWYSHFHPRSPLGELETTVEDSNGSSSVPDSLPDASSKKKKKLSLFGNGRVANDDLKVENDG